MCKTILLVFSVWLVVVVCGEHAVHNKSVVPQSFSPLRMMRKFYTECESNEDMIKCLKIQAIKLTDRALKIPYIKLIDGISVTQKEEGKSFGHDTSYAASGDGGGEPAIEKNLSKMSAKQIDAALNDRANKFFDSHQIQVSVPKLMNSGQQSSARLIEEGRKKMKKYYGPFLAAIAIKGGILAMAYHSIAVVAGKALIIGKIALIISAIIGLKKLVTPEGHEKTTYEIVKHPHVQQTHSYSSSHNEYEGGGGGGGHESSGGGGSSYGRTFDDDELLMQDRAYRAHQPISI